MRSTAAANILAKAPVEHASKVKRRLLRHLDLAGKPSGQGQPGWRGVTMTPATACQLQELRRRPLDPPIPGAPGSLDSMRPLLPPPHFSTRNLRPSPTFQSSWDATPASVQPVKKTTGRR